MSFKCPNCETTLYNRAHRVCGACGVALPPELLLPEADIRHFEERAKEEKKAKLEAMKNVGPGPDGNAIAGSTVQ